MSAAINEKNCGGFSQVLKSCFTTSRPICYLIFALLIIASLVRDRWLPTSVSWQHWRCGLLAIIAGCFRRWRARATGFQAAVSSPGSICGSLHHHYAFH
jgi:hypothetical protein